MFHPLCLVRVSKRVIRARLPASTVQREQCAALRALRRVRIRVRVRVRVIRVRVRVELGLAIALALALRLER